MLIFIYGIGAHDRLAKVISGRSDTRYVLDKKHRVVESLTCCRGSVFQPRVETSNQAGPDVIKRHAYSVPQVDPKPCLRIPVR